MKNKKLTNEKFLELMDDYGLEAKENIEGVLNAIVYIIQNCDNKNLNKTLNEVINDFVVVKKDRMFNDNYSIKANFPEILANKILEKAKTTQEFVAKQAEMAQKTKEMQKAYKKELRAIQAEELAKKYVNELNNEQVF